MRRTASPTTRIAATTSSDFVLPGTNPLPSPKDPCVGRGGVRPPAPPEAEAYLVIRLREKTAGDQSLEPGLTRRLMRGLFPGQDS